MRRSCGIDVEHDALDLIADVDQLRGMLHALGPGHLADVDQTFDALLEFDEGSVVGDADDAAGDMRADRITVLSVEPRIGRELLEAERHALFLFVVLENLDLDLVADVDQVLGMREASPGHVGDVEQAVEAAEIDESAVLGEVLDHTGEDCALFEVLESLGTLFILLAFEQFLARDHDVAALLVQLDDGDFDGLTLHAVEVADGAQIDLRTGQERVGAVNVDGEAALDAVDHDGLDGLLFVMSLLDFFPGMNALRLLMRQVDVAFFGLALVAHHVDFVARLEFGVSLVIEHFREGQHAFRLGANVDHHVRRGQLQHRASDDAIFTHCLFGFGGEGLERSGEVLDRSGLVVGRAHRTVRLGGGFRRHGLGEDRLGLAYGGGSGIGIVGVVEGCLIERGLVEQGYASLLPEAGPVLRTAGRVVWLWWAHPGG